VFQRLLISTESGIAHVQLARADKRNALDLTAFEELAAAAAQLAADRSVRAVVMSGQGTAFCAGIDISLLANPGDVQAILKIPAGAEANAAQSAAWAWHKLPVPVIAAVHGSAFGAGLQLMSAADIRYVHPDAKLSLMELEYGIVPDMSGSQLWKAFVRADVIKELAYTSRIFSGSEALSLGFATRAIDDPLAAAMATARIVAAKSPHAIRAAKRMFNAQLSDTVAQGLQREADEQLALLFSDNQVEAVKAKLEKRAPHFSDPVEK
jgi:enoyl-CoA hydratase/carnithine racemase